MPKSWNLFAAFSAMWMYLPAFLMCRAAHTRLPFDSDFAADLRSSSGSS